MKRFRLLTPILMAVFVIAALAPAGAESTSAAKALPTVTSGTATYTMTYQNSDTYLYKVTFVGTASGSTTGSVLATMPYLEGTLKRVAFIPTAGVTGAYDVTLVDTDGVTDLLAASGANLSSTTTTSVCPALSTYFQFPLASRPVLMALNCGASQGGQLWLWVKRN